MAQLDLVGVVGQAPALAMDGIGETHLSYQITRFSNGDADISCTAAIGSAQEGSSSKYYPSTITGAVRGACAAAADLPPFGMGVGAWDFEGAMGGPRVTYRDDVGHPFKDNSYRFSENNCNAMRLGDDGVWTDVTLADAFD